jgi:hypothetical protein
MRGAACYLLIPALSLLAGCEPYTYDANGEPVPYRGQTRANCGTPEQPKACAEGASSKSPPRTSAPNYNPTPSSYRPY